MNVMARLFAVLLLAGLAGASMGQESPATPPPGESEAAAPQTQDAPSRPGASQQPPAADAPRVPAPAAPPAEDDVFVPTEEIAADEEVTFPVDI